MSSEKVSAWIPIYASMRVTAPMPENWSDMSAGDKADYILNFGEREGGLCCHCTKNVETDFEPVPYALDIMRSEYEGEAKMDGLLK